MNIYICSILFVCYIYNIHVKNIYYHSLQTVNLHWHFGWCSSIFQDSDNYILIWDSNWAYLYLWYFRISARASTWAQCLCARIYIKSLKLWLLPRLQIHAYLYLKDTNRLLTSSLLFFRLWALHLPSFRLDPGAWHVIYTRV